MAVGYPHADSCRGALERMGAIAVQMCLSTAEFSFQVNKPCSPVSEGASPWSSSPPNSEMQLGQSKDTRKPSHLPRFDMNLEGLLSGLDQNQKPSRRQMQPPHTQILEDFNSTLSGQIPQSPFAEYQDLVNRESQSGQQQDYNNTPESISPISIPWSYDQSSEAGMLPAISLDFLESNLGESDALFFAAGGDLNWRIGSDTTFGGEAKKLGFSIAVDSLHGFDKSVYDYLDAAWLSMYCSDEAGDSHSAMSEADL